MGDMIEEMKMYVNDIQDKMEKDSYRETVKLLKEVEEYSIKIRNLESKVVDDINRTEKSFVKTTNDIQTLKNQIQKLGEDPNFISRY